MMKTLYDTSTLQDVLSRIDKLTPASRPLWGKMNVAQMMAHCSATVEMAVGDTMPKRTLLAKIVAPLFRKGILGTKPFGKNSPTGKEFIIADERDFDREKAKLVSLLKRMTEGGTAGVTKGEHAFLGKITPEQWGENQYKHTDHHLQQFGV